MTSTILDIVASSWKHTQKRTVCTSVAIVRMNHKDTEYVDDIEAVTTTRTWVVLSCMMRKIEIAVSESRIYWFWSVNGPRVGTEYPCDGSICYLWVLNIVASSCIVSLAASVLQKTPFFGHDNYRLHINYPIIYMTSLDRVDDEPMVLKQNLRRGRRLRAKAVYLWSIFITTLYRNIFVFMLIKRSWRRWDNASIE